jgi:UDP-N-acetyl-D-mannosaminuronic acid dehydrogenase
MAFKGITAADDLRGSMSVKVLDALRKAHPEAEIGIFDPVIAQHDLEAAFPEVATFAEFGDAVRGASVVVIANNHPALGRMSPRTIGELTTPDGFIFDYWNHFSHLPASEIGDSYFAVGNSGMVF